MSGEAFSGEASGLRDVDVGGVPSSHLHAQRCVRVFGDGLFGNAADLVERRTAQDRAGAAKERCVPEVVAVLNYAVEELTFVGDDVELAEIALERVGRVKVMRRLHHGQLGVAHEPADGHLEEAARGHVVGIKDSHER